MQSLKFVVVVALIIFAFTKIDGQQAVTSTCGRRLSNLVPRMVNASLADQWPWHAAIFHKDDHSNWVYECGGTVIDSKSILTAAHCVSKYSRPMPNATVSVFLGRLDLDVVNETGSQPFEVAEIIIHPNYKRIDLSNDIAIIRLSDDATFNEFVQPICLWSADNTEIAEIMGKQNTVIGWGRTEFAENSRILRQASMPVVNSMECLESNRPFAGSMLTSTKFCAGLRNGTGICDGDSGGSMTFEQNGVHYIRGIVCATPNTKSLCDPTHYAIFTDAAQYLDWIGLHVKSVNSVRCDNKLNGNGLTCFIHLYIRNSGRQRKIFFEDATNTNVTTLSIKGVLQVLPDLSDAINKFENLKTLQLAGIKLEIVEREKLAVFNRIESLDLSGNRITEIPFEKYPKSFDSFNRHFFYTNIFEELHNLTRIDLGSNLIVILPNKLFQTNLNLEEINLVFNSICFLQQDIFQELHKLTRIDLSFNQLEYMPVGLFRDNENLKEISLLANKISFLHRDAFEKLHHLTTINLGRNELETLPYGLFRDNENLKEIWLGSNKINALHQNVFEGLHNLVIIDLKRNHLETLPERLFRDNRNLDEILLDTNHIRFLHRNIFEGLHNLTIINLGGNGLETLPVGLFRDNENLKEIFLYSNKISSLHRDAFEKLHHLTAIILWKNELEYLPDGLFRDNENLKEIWLGSNKINALYQNVFEILHNLTRIDLEDNQLDTLPVGLFRDNENLVSIQLSQNKIKRIECNFYNLPKLNVLDLSNNVCINERCEGDRCRTTLSSEILKKIQDQC